MHSFFQRLNQDLRQAGQAKPMLLIDAAALEQNMAYVRQQLETAKHLRPRLVVKSLACLPLLKTLSHALDCQRFMVFHIDHLALMQQHFARTDLLLGKPMPIRAVEGFYAQYPQSVEGQLHWLIDSYARLQQYLAFAQQQQLQLNINIEIDVGLHRGGIQQLEDFVALLHLIQQHPAHLKLTGLMGYDAHVTKLPKLLKTAQTAYAESQQMYQQYIQVLKTQFHDMYHDQLCFNGGGSPTFALHVAQSVCNDLSFGSMLLKPSDFDSEYLAALQPALYIASPVLKVLDAVQLPGLPTLKIFKRLHKKQAVFLYGGYWMGHYVYPPKAHPHALYGRSTNQEMICVDPQYPIAIDDYVFIRPSQSEVVIPQFAQSYLYRVQEDTSFNTTSSCFEAWDNFRE